MLVLDTSAVSAVLRRAPGALARLEAEDPSAVVLCSPVAAEVHFGLARLVPDSHRRRVLEGEYGRLRAAVRWLDWREDAAIEFGRLKARLQERGTPLEDLDVAIGSIALSLSARLATLNVRHFARIDGLALDDWSEPRAELLGVPR